MNKLLQIAMTDSYKFLIKEKQSGAIIVEIEPANSQSNTGHILLGDEYDNVELAKKSIKIFMDTPISFFGKIA